MFAIAVLVPLGVARTTRGAGQAPPNRTWVRRTANCAACQVQIAAQRGLQAELDQAQAQLAAMRTEQAHLQGGARPLVDDLAQLWGWGYAPAGTFIMSVSGTDRGFRVEGTSPDALTAIAFADALARRAVSRWRGPPRSRPAARAPGSSASRWCDDGAVRGALRAGVRQLRERRDRSRPARALAQRPIGMRRVRPAAPARGSWSRC